MIKVQKGSKPRISQGDIYRNIEMIEYIYEKSGIVEISKIQFPLVIVLTQDCDLEQDYRTRHSRSRPETQDKLIVSALVAPLYNAEHVYQGSHLSELGLEMQKISKKKTPGNRLRNNETPRYHYLSFPESVPIVDSVIDFKHYFTVNVEYLRKIRHSNFVIRLAPLFREDVSQRFSAYLSRIGLP